MATADPPLELRVHGVGGPQAMKVLGCLHEEDLSTLPPFEDEWGGSVSTDDQTRFARRLPDDLTEAYEWGALTTGTWSKALWVVYLPFTVINAGGWAHAPGRRPDRPGALVRSHLVVTHLLAFAATATYVLWIGNIVVDLVGGRWGDRVEAAGTDGVVWSLAAEVNVATLVGFVVLVGLLGAFAAVRRGELEAAGRPVNEGWRAIPAVADPAFFAHARARRRLMWWHLGVGGLVAAAVVVGDLAGEHHSESALLVVALAQLVMVALLAVLDAGGRAVAPRADAAAGAAEGVPPAPRAIPFAATFAALGTLMAHAAFAGASTLLRPVLSGWPVDDPLPPGPELVAAELLGWFVVALVVLAAAVSVVCLALRGAGSGVPVLVCLARRTPWWAAVVLVSVVVPATVVLGRRVADEPSVATGTPIQALGALVLTALPALVFLVLRGDYDTGPARVVGNIWDVLTFWPRRFHPLGAPPSAERAVPELRARIVWVRERRGGLVVVAHSQGSVLAVAALGAAGEPRGVAGTSLVTIGSPLGSLYAPTWPAYILPLLREVAGQDGLRWQNYWRDTDPVGAGVPFARNERRPDPARPRHAELDAAHELAPGDRPLPWGRIAGHGNYFSDAAVQACIREGRRSAGAA